MIISSNTNPKKATLFSPRQSPQQKPAQNREKKVSSWRCRGLNDCMIMNSGTTPSTSQPEQNHQASLQATSRLEQQVVDLEKEVQKQKELRIMYRKRMERTNDYLRYCLQIAQDNGFLDLIIHPKQLSNINCSPQLPSMPISAPHPDLTVLIHESKSNGWYIDPHEIELLDKIGEGSTAEIYKGVWRGHDVAVKCIHQDFFNTNENGVTFFVQELKTLSKQRHRFVLQLMGACFDPPNYGWIVTEYLSTTLKEWLYGPGNRRKERIIPLPCFKKRVEIAMEIGQAMQYLHEQNPKLIHRDLKPSNIFLDDSNHVRVADFGHARFLDDKEKALTGETGTYVYMAPEVMRCEPYNEKCDVYSFGIILNELITGDYPYIDTDYGPTKIAMEVVESNLRPTLPVNDEKLGDLIELICLSWDGDASVRPTFAYINSTLRSIRNKLTQNRV